MGYATTTDLQARYNERDLRLMTDADAQVFDAARAAQALQDADEEIDTYLGRRYVLPLFSISLQTLMATPGSLVRIGCDIAIYRLQTLRPADDVKDARQRYDDAIKFLKMLATGDTQMVDAQLLPGLAVQPQDAAVAVGTAQFGSYGSPFSRGYR